MSLTGHTIFISGASRGIGKAIGLKAAKDGANIVIAAKTADPHPKLPGTIYTAADEIEKAGGKALPCIVDIRSEDNVRSAVKKAVDHFGGIDILVNNASAISLTPSLTTPMKTYDLMNSINARGTYLCSHVCMPHIIEAAKAGKQSHVLNISPPLSMKEIWFKNHTAYTMAKFGMSMCTLGMAGEFREDGVACNALWPRTGIWTAALKMLGGGLDEAAKGCRTEDIMADAAYLMLTQDPKTYTGKFEIDEDVLRELAGMKDFTHYECYPGEPLMPDFFIDNYEERYGKVEDNSPLGQAQKEATATENSNLSPIDQVFAKMNSVLSAEGPKYVEKISTVYEFNMKDTKNTYFLDLKNGSGSAGQTDSAGSVESQVQMTLKEKDFINMFNGKLQATTAFMTGKLKIKGDMKKAMALEKMMKKMQ